MIIVLFILYPIIKLNLCPIPISEAQKVGIKPFDSSLIQLSFCFFVFLIVAQ